jgi:hypothetical protein
VPGGLVTVYLLGVVFSLPAVGLLQARGKLMAFAICLLLLSFAYAEHQNGKRYRQRSYERTAETLRKQITSTALSEANQRQSDQIPFIPSNISEVARSHVGRIILVEGGFDPIHHQAYLQWLQEPSTPEEETTILGTTEISELNGGQWRLFDCKFKDPRTITLTAYYRYSSRPHKVTIRLGSPETKSYKFEGDLRLREDEH